METLEAIFDDAHTHTHTQKRLHFLDAANAITFTLTAAEYLKRKKRFLTASEKQDCS